MIKEFYKKNKFNILIGIIYSITTLVIVFFHENWRDEAQSWLIARDLNLIDVIKQMKYEGHPCLWYLILFPFAKLGFPYITENLISWGIMSITGWLVIEKAPFDRYIKILILLTSPFIYLYPAISRSYCLIALAIVLIAITYKNRKKEPIKYTLSILILAYTHVIMLGLVGMLFLFFFLEELIIGFREKTKEGKKKIITCLIIAIIGLLALFFQLFGSLQTNATVNSEIKVNLNTFNIIWYNIMKIVSMLFGEEFAHAIVVLAIILLIYELMKHTKNAIIIFISICFQLFIYTFIYSSILEQRAATILLIILLFVWIQKEECINVENKKMVFFDVSLSIILLFNISNSLLRVEKDFKYTYSGAKETAEYINNNINCNDAIFVSSHTPLTSSIIPYTKTKMYWSPQLDKFFTFITWNEENESQYEVPIDEVLNNTNKKFKDKNDIYFIYCYNWDNKSLEYFITNTNAIEIFRSETNTIKMDEKYIVYKLYND